MPRRKTKTVLRAHEAASLAWLLPHEMAVRLTPAVLARFESQRPGISAVLREAGVKTAALVYGTGPRCRCRFRPDFVPEKAIEFFDIPVEAPGCAIVLDKGPFASEGACWAPALV